MPRRKGPGGPNADRLRLTLDEAERQGWRIRGGSGRHWVLYAPNGKDIVVTSSSPSDKRSYVNFLARLRRTGCFIDRV